MSLPVLLAVTIPEIPWGAISPELVLFGSAILVLLLDTAGQGRLRAAFLAGGLLVVAAGFLFLEADQVVLPGLLAAAAVVQFALTAALRGRPRLLGAVLTMLGFAATLGVVAWQWSVHATETLIATDQLLGDMVAVDGVALFTRVSVCVAGLIVVPLGVAYLEDRRVHRGEYYPLVLLAATGMTLLGSSADLLMVFIAIEILSLALYIMAAFAKRDLASQEGAFKYFLLGAFSSAILLYGIALVYGATATTNIAAAGRALAGLDPPEALGLVAIALLLVGLAFKVAAVPFHMWTPDVYQGAPTPVTGFLATATKAAAFAAFLRIFVGALAPLQWSWQPAVWALAAATMLLGALLAIVQDDVKRMLAYSSIAHAGFMLVGVLPSTREGVSAVLFYAFAYAFMTLGAFGVLALLERRQRKALAVADLAGLGRREPLLAGAFGLFLLSLAGLPGTAGFIAKLGVFLAAVDGGQVGIVVIAVIGSAVAFFFYVRIIRAMFMDAEPGHLSGVPVPRTLASSVGLGVAAAATVVFGVLPGLVLTFTGQAASFAG